MSSLLRDRSEDGGRSPLSSTLARELKGEKMIPVYGFSRVKDPVVGETRDLRAPWALEETGLPYRVHGLDYVEGDTKTGDNRKRPGKTPVSAPVLMPGCALNKRDRCTRAHYWTGCRDWSSSASKP